MNSVRNRILLFFTLFGLFSLSAVFIGMRSTNLISVAAQSVAKVHLPLVYAMGKMDAALQRLDGSVYRYVSSGDRYWLDVCEKERLQFNQWFVKVHENATEEAEQLKLDQIDELYIQYDNEIRQALLNPNRRSSETQQILRRSDRFLAEIQKLIEDLSSLREGMSLVHQAQIESSLTYHRRVAYSFIVVLGILFVFLAFYLWYDLVQPLSLLLDGIRNFTRGKMDIMIPSVGKDELGELQEAFNEMSRELTRERRRLKEESQSDALTGLFNMRFFRRQLSEEFARSHRYGRNITTLMIDVDHFKAYNDRNGHPAGDIVLKEISRILIRNIRGTDIAARYGGEEFVVLLPETALQDAVIVAEKIRRTVQEHHFPFKSDEGAAALTVSIGAASYPDVKISNDQSLIESADKALYLAKKSGRNQVCVFSKGDITPVKVHPESDAKESTSPKG